MDHVLDAWPELCCSLKSSAVSVVLSYSSNLKALGILLFHVTINSATPVLVSFRNSSSYWGFLRSNQNSLLSSAN